jgi:GNAT superfamily N-acetyltransferase
MIKEFQTKNAQSLADMFNASDEGWPSGFTHGLEITPEEILERKKKTKIISTFVAWDSDRIVGIAELVEYWKEPNVSYIGLLNVVPTHHGRGYGKNLLKACVKKASELQCTRMDLHTWSGNMKAVPLYKKTGFFWVPKTTVHMKNYLPLILNMDAAQPYFEKHDWYTTFKRELKVEEDDFHGVYPYQWEEDGNMLSVVIDAESGGVTTFENDSIFVSQHVEKAFAGCLTTVTWVMKNKTESPLHVTLLSRGDKGIAIEKKESFMLETEYTITEKVAVDADIDIREKEEPPHVLTTDVIINGMAVTLCSGLRVNRPVDVSTYPEYLFLPPGQREVLVVLKNNQDVQAEGVITCENTGESHSFCIDPHYTEGIPFSIHVKDCELLFTSGPIVYTIPVRTDDGANVMQKDNKVILENAHTRVIVSLTGGETTIYNKKINDIIVQRLHDQLGPPFWPSELGKALYTVKTQHEPGRAAAEVTVESKEYNARLTRRMEMDSGPVITVCHSIVPQPDVNLCFAGGIFMFGGALTVPLQEAIVSEHPVEEDFPLEYEDLPRDPSEYKEQWMCYERDGSAFGLIWKTCKEIPVDEEGFLNIIKSTADTNPLYLYSGSGTWEDVRAAWSRIHGKVVHKEEPVKIWNITPSVIVCADDTCRNEMTLRSHRGKPLKGTCDGNPFEIKRKSPFTFIKEYDGLTLGVNVRHVEIETDLFLKKIPVSVVRVGKKGDIKITENDIITIDNGLYTIQVAPQFYGSVIFFGKDENHVLTSYPEPTQFNWVKPWYGGIHPLLYTHFREFPGRLHKEVFTYELLDVTNHSIRWQGCKTVCTCEEPKGIQVHTAYLTTAHSNVLMIRSTLKNLTSAPFYLRSGLSLFLQPDGSYKEATAYYDAEGLYERKRTQYGGWTDVHDWAAVRGASTYLTVIADTLTVADMGKDGAHTFVIKSVQVNPQEEVTADSWVVAADSLKQSRQYKALRWFKWT